MSSESLSPEAVRSALVLKLLAFARLPTKAPKNLNVYVLHAPGMEAEFRKAVGRKFGKYSIGAVSSGQALPDPSPDILYIGKTAAVDEAVAYALKHKVLTVCESRSDVRKGVTLGVEFDAKGKPIVLLNTTASKQQGVSWVTAMFKIAQVVK